MPDLVIPCSGLTEIFFSEQVSDVRFAIKICKTCEMREPCLEGALRRREKYGVWGGKVFKRSRRKPGVKVKSPDVDRVVVNQPVGLRQRTGAPAKGKSA